MPAAELAPDAPPSEAAYRFHERAADVLGVEADALPPRRLRCLGTGAVQAP